MKKIFVTLLATAAMLLSASAQSVPTDSLATATPVEAEISPLTSAEDLLDMGNKAYIDGEYEQALEYYNAVLDRDLFSASLYYNTGNAYFKTNHIGKAILFYNRALLLDPSMEDAEYNLAIAEARTKDKIAQVPQFFVKRWVVAVQNLFDCTTWSVLSLIARAFAMLCALMFLLARRIAIRKAGFYGALAAIVLLVVTTAFAVAERNDILSREGAVVMMSAISVKSSPDRTATDLFVLHEGTKVRVTAQVGDWSEVVIADGNKGWTESKNIEKI